MNINQRCSPLFISTYPLINQYATLADKKLIINYLNKQNLEIIMVVFSSPVLQNDSWKLDTGIKCYMSTHILLVIIETTRMEQYENSHNLSITYTIWLVTMFGFLSSIMYFFCCGENSLQNHQPYNKLCNFRF